MPSMKRIKLVVFDLDGTLTKVGSVWRYIHEALGTWDRGSLYAAMFFRGQVSYKEWARLDAGLWRGKTLEEMERIVSSISYTRGAAETVSFLQSHGVKVAVVSAGLSLIADKALRDLGLDYAIANELIVKDGRVTGEVIINVAFEGKGEVLKKLLRSLGCEVSQCLAVGDDLADIYLFREAGFRIAFNPRSPELEKEADAVIRSDDLQSILPYVKPLLNRE